MRPGVLVLGTVESDPPPGIEGVGALADVVYAATPEDLAERIGQADVLFFWHPRPGVLEPVWPKADKLRWIQSASAGVNSVLFPELVESDVMLTNARGVFDQPIAEYVLGLIVAFAKGFPQVFADQPDRVWRYRETEPVAGKRLLVVGPGPIGRAIGRAARGLSMRVAAVGRAARPGDDVFDEIIGSDSLHAALAEADYVVDALPLTDGTHHLFDARAFAAMKGTARFINIGRGGTVDEAALADAVRMAEIGGAALDVFEEEPLPPDSPLWELEGVIVSPHMSGDVFGWQERIVELFAENLRRYVVGEPLLNVVDKRLGHPV